MMKRTNNAKLQETKAYDTYWRFAFERQNIFMRKFAGVDEHLTDDPTVYIEKKGIR